MIFAVLVALALAIVLLGACAVAALYVISGAIGVIWAFFRIIFEALGLVKKSKEPSLEELQEELRRASGEK